MVNQIIIQISNRMTCQISFKGKQNFHGFHNLIQNSAQLRQITLLTGGIHPVAAAKFALTPPAKMQLGLSRVTCLCVLRAHATVRPWSMVFPAATSAFTPEKAFV